MGTGNLIHKVELIKLPVPFSCVVIYWKLSFEEHTLAVHRYKDDVIPSDGAIPGI